MPNRRFLRQIGGRRGGFAGFPKTGPETRFWVDLVAQVTPGVSKRLGDVGRVRGGAPRGVRGVTPGVRPARPIGGPRNVSAWHSGASPPGVRPLTPPG